ncbi:Glyoxalase-like domain-containing protein [Paenibacillus sophorae]|uniref:Glyoxalase-like domain-containing protein n=1 Tax=Paenibacillus sophorae TaxID=1333845 RepID=A0A1H8VJ76_9BACL|nr:VOC family protein [Paenibacillus sophorae]QWU17216.1 VOC family protein [Paenibacillus sophorae]SEP15486.1 Glyoxalase-like domain-containing protein [Paenibacillus sophorae]
MASKHWDHLVHYVNNLDQPVEIFREHGLVAFKGGSHTEWGTYNSLSYFGLTYIEFLGIENLELAKATEHNRVVKDAVDTLPEHEVLSRVVIRTDDIEEMAASLEAAGLSLSPIMDGKRLDNKGRLIEWRMMTIDGDFGGLVYPFIIQWKGSDEERLDRLTSSGIISPHPAGNAEIKRAVFHVSDPAAAAEHWGKLFGLTVLESEDKPVTLKIGDKFFDFVKGDENQFKQVIFETDSVELKGKTIRIGEGEYVFT